MQRELRPAVDVDEREVVHLADARHGERRGVRALAHRRVLDRLDVHDDVRVRQRALDRGLDGVRGGVALADGRARGDADHDVGELAAARLAHAEPAHLDRRAQLADRRERGRLGLRGRAIHQHVDVRLDQPRGGEQHEHADEERGDRVAVLVAVVREDEPDEHRERAEQVAAEVQRVRRERRALVAPRGPPRDDRAAEVDRDHDAEDGERVPRHVHRRVA